MAASVLYRLATIFMGRSASLGGSVVFDVRHAPYLQRIITAKFPSASVLAQQMQLSVVFRRSGTCDTSKAAQCCLTGRPTSS